MDENPYKAPISQDQAKTKTRRSQTPRALIPFLAIAILGVLNPLEVRLLYYAFDIVFGHKADPSLYGLWNVSLRISAVSACLACLVVFKMRQLARAKEANGSATHL